MITIEQNSLLNIIITRDGFARVIQSLTPAKDTDSIKWVDENNKTVEITTAADITSITDRSGNVVTAGNDIDLIWNTLVSKFIFNDNDTVANSLNDSGQIDASGRIRVSTLSAQLDIKQINDNQPLFYDRVSSGAASQVYSKNKGGVEMSVSGSGDYAICQSKMWANYFSGKSQVSEITFSGFANDTDVVKRAGYFSSNTVAPYDSNKDGIWFEADGTDYSLNIEKNGVSALSVTQDNWNINTLQEFDGSKFNVLVIQFLYLGGTAVKFGFFINGLVKWVHQYDHAGLVTSTFVESPNQPVRYEIRSSSGSGSFDQICALVASEGGQSEVGAPISFDYVDFQANTSGTDYAVQAYRLKDAYRNITTVIKNITFNSTTGDIFTWKLCLNPTISNGTLTFSDVTNSALQIADGNGGAGGGAIQVSDFGRVIESGASQGNFNLVSVIDSSLRLGSQIDGTKDILAIVITPQTNGLDIDTSTAIREFI